MSGGKVGALNCNINWTYRQAVIRKVPCPGKRKLGRICVEDVVIK
jgi:hypothetical protein